MSCTQDVILSINTECFTYRRSQNNLYLSVNNQARLIIYVVKVCADCRCSCLENTVYQPSFINKIVHLVARQWKIKENTIILHSSFNRLTSNYSTFRQCFVDFGSCSISADGYSLVHRYKIKLLPLGLAVYLSKI